MRSLKVTIRKSCAHLRQTFVGAPPVQNSKYEYPVPELKRLFLGAWKTDATGEDGCPIYRLGFLLTNFQPLSSREPAEGFMCQRYGLGPNVDITRDEMLACAVYLGQVSRGMSKRGLMAYIDSMPDGQRRLHTSDEIDLFIYCLLANKELYKYIPDLDISREIDGVAGRLKIYCDNFVMEAHAAGRWKLKKDFNYAPLPILDIRGHVMTEKEFHAIPEYTNP